MDSKFLLLSFLFLVSGVVAQSSSLVAPANFTIYATPQNVSINSTISATNLANVTLNWSYSNYSFYNSSLVLSMDFDNVPSLGENQSKIVDNSLYGNNGSWLGDSFKNGVLVASPSWVTGKFGMGLQFNDTNYMNASSFNFTTLSQPFTAMAWLNASYVGSYGCIICSGTSWGAFSMQLGPSGTVYVGTTVGTRIAQANTFSNNTWTHLAFTYNPNTGNGTLYKDGVIVNTTLMANATDYWNGLLMGSAVYRGVLDSGRVYSRVLSPSEINAEMNSSRPVSGFGLVADYEFEGSLSNATLGDPVVTSGGTGNQCGGVNISIGSKPLVLTDVVSVQAPSYPQTQIAVFFANGSLYYNSSQAVGSSVVSFPNLLLSANSHYFICGRLDNATSTVYVYYKGSGYAGFSGNGVTFVSSGITNWSGGSYSVQPNTLYAISRLDFLNFSIAQDTHNFVSGKYEGAGNYNGSNYVSFNLPNMTNGFTYTNWFKSNSFSDSQELIYSANPYNSSSLGFLTINSAGSPAIFYSGWQPCNLTATLNSWNKLDVVGTSTTLTIYLNSIPCLTFPNYVTLSSSTGIYSLGVRLDALGPPNAFNGSIDGVRVWNRSLTAGEVLQQYRSNLAKYSTSGWLFNSTQPINNLGRYPFTFSICDSVGCAREARDLYYGGFQNLSVFDESSGSPLTANITFANATNSSVFVTNQSWLFFDQYPVGNVILSAVNGTAYPQRSYSLSLTNLSQSNTSIYLLGVGSGQYVTFFVQTTSGQAINGALVNVTRSGNDVGSGFTDSTGAISFFLSPSSTYSVEISAAGFEPQTVSISSSVNQFTIRLLPIGGSVVFPSGLQNTSWAFSPSANFIPLNYTNNQTISFTIVDTDSNLSYFKLYLYFNGSVIYSYNATTAAGGSIVYSLNTSYYGTRAGTYPMLSAVVVIQKNGFDSMNTSKNWLISSTGTGSLSLQTALDNTLANPALRFIVVIVGLIIVAKVAAMVSGDSIFGIISALVAIAVLMFAGLLNNASGQPDWFTYSIISLVGLSLFLLRSGI